MKKVNLLIIIGLLVISGYAMRVCYEMGIVRDAFNISGNAAVSLSWLELFVVLGLPILFMILNIIFLIAKRYSKVIGTILIILSIGVILLSGFFTYKETIEMSKYTQAEQMK